MERAYAVASAASKSQVATTIRNRVEDKTNFCDGLGIYTSLLKNEIFSLSSTNQNECANFILIIQMHRST
jgi:hypothetical protein